MNAQHGVLVLIACLCCYVNNYIRAVCLAPTAVLLATTAIWRMLETMPM